MPIFGGRTLSKVVESELSFCKALYDKYAEVQGE